jgi:hypothetical protein
MSITTLRASSTTRRMSASSCWVEQEVDRWQRPVAAWRARGCSSSHLEQGVGAALGFGAGEFGGVDVAVAEFGDGGLPVVVEFAVDVPGEDLQELRAANIVELRVEVPAAVRVLGHHRVASLTVAFGLVLGTDRVCQRFEDQGATFELQV